VAAVVYFSQDAAASMGCWSSVGECIHIQHVN